MTDKYKDIVGLKIWFNGHAEWGEKLYMDGDGAQVICEDGHIETVEWFNVLDEIRVP